MRTRVTGPGVEAGDLLGGEAQPGRGGVLLNLRSAANPWAAAIMRDSIERNYQRRLADARPGADTTPRAALLIAICAGVILDRMLLGHTELNSPGTENLIPYLRAALDAVAKAPDQAAAP